MTAALPDGVLVRIAHATFGYDGTAVLRDVDLDVRDSDFIGVVGPSGSGKTSLLRLLLGTVAPQHGTVVRRPGLDGRLRAAAGDGQLELPGHRRRVRADGRAADGACRGRPARRGPTSPRCSSGSASARSPSRHIRELSGGQQQRMFIARALLRGPQLLLIDEPTSGVDVTTRHDMLHLLGELNAEGVAILLTTHDLNGVAAHLPQLVALHKTVIAAGTPARRHHAGRPRADLRRADGGARAPGHAGRRRPLQHRATVRA